MRRVRRVRATADRQLLEQKRQLELETAQHESIEQAEARRWALFMSVYFPDNRDPMWKSLEAYGCGPVAWQQYAPDESDLGEVIEAFSNRDDVAAQMELIPRGIETKH
jgi:hypothetical protein